MKKENDTIVMKNELINARYNLKTLEELKIFVYAISTIKKDINKFKAVNINIKDFMELTGSDNKYTRIKSLGKKLIKSTFQTNDTGDDKSWTFYTIFSKVKYRNNKGILSLKFNKDIKPYLLNITKDHQYTLSNFKNLAHLSSSYAHRIYLMLKQYQNTDHKKRNFVLSKLQEVLQCPKSYNKDFQNFNNKVLKISIKEINEKTDINILKIEQHKTGRKITDITIHFELKQEINTNKLNISTYKHFVKSLRKEREGQEVLNPRAENIKSYGTDYKYLPEYRVFMKKGLLTCNAKKSLLTKEESEYFYKAIYKIEKQKYLEQKK